MSGVNMRFLRILALAGAVALAMPQFALAQDGELGKKGGGKGGGSSQSGGGKSGGSSQSGGGKSGGTSPGGSVSGGKSGGSSTGGELGRPRSGGTSQSGGGLGRPERPQPGQDDGGLTVKRGGGESRSGQVHYGTTSNVRALGKPEGQYAIGEIPQVSSSRSIALEAKGESRHVRTEVRDHRIGDSNYRFGYWHYQGNWCDDWFNYPYYRFRWDPYDCVPSPFYYYGHLPPYISCVRITLGSFSWTACTTRYAWVPFQYDGGYGWGRNRRYDDLDYAVNDIGRAFRERRMRLIDDYIGRHVVVEYGYGERYRMNGDDFYDMLRDAVEGTRTESYLVQDVCRDGDRATIVAYHTFYNPWGIRESVRHVYGLVGGRRGYEIEYFRTERF